MALELGQEGDPGAPQACPARPGGWARPLGLWAQGAPLWHFFALVFFIYSKINLRKVSSNSENVLFLHKNNTKVVLLKTASVLVSFTQIMQIRGQNKSKSVWKSRYVGDVSTPPSLTHFLSSSNSVDKLKSDKEKLLQTHLLLLVYINLTSNQVFSKDHEVNTYMITLSSHIYSYQ